mgnify:CR=1 FL=1
MSQDHGNHDSGGHGRPYLMFWVNMVLGLAVMYVVMFTMIDGLGDFRNNLNMFYMAVTMWAPMGVFMLATMPGMFPKRRMNVALYIVFALLTAISFWATRARGPDRRPSVHRIDDPAPFRRDPDVPGSQPFRSRAHDPVR